MRERAVPLPLVLAALLGTTAACSDNSDQNATSSSLTSAATGASTATTSETEGDSGQATSGEESTSAAEDTGTETGGSTDTTAGTSTDGSAGETESSETGSVTISSLDACQQVISRLARLGCGGGCACDPADPNASCMTPGEVLDACTYLVAQTAIDQDPTQDLVDACVSEVDADSCGFTTLFDYCTFGMPFSCGPACTELGVVRACADVGGDFCSVAGIAGCF